MNARAALTLRTGAILIATAVSLGLIATGCGGSNASSNADSSTATPKQGGVLRVSQGEEVITLTALETVDPSSINVVSQINETLFKVNAEGKNEPWLVTKVEKSDGDRVWRLTLRKGVEFSTGRPMTSADVRFTLDQARKSAYWESVLAGITSVDAPTPSTIVITNAKPAPELAAQLSQWSFGIVPKNWGGVSEKEFAQHPIGTGPFLLGPWKHGESLTLERNPHYWKNGQPYLDKVVFQTVANAESRVSQLKGGDLDVIYSPPWSQLDAIEQTPGLSVGDFPLGFVEGITISARNSLFQNRKVREAVDLAVDREGVVSAALGGHGEPAGSFLPSVVPYSDPSIKPVAQDTARASELLKAAEEEGVDPTFTMTTVGGNPYWETAAQILQQNFDEVGFKASIKNVDQAALGEIASSGKYDMILGEGYSSTPTPLELCGFYVSFGGPVSIGIDVSEYEKILNEAASETNSERRRQLWYQFQQMVQKELYSIQISSSPYSWAFKEDVGGFSVSATGIPWFADAGFTG
jgi:peptide/nickel transport system substrate-binding protein